jgi:glycosyltransferase involved in cell wall biosynthesis
MPAKHIVHVITGLSIGGAETALYRLVTHAEGSRGTATVISLSDEGHYGPRLRAAGIAVHALGMRRGRFSLKLFLRLVRLLRAERPDVVQTWLYHSDLLGTLAARLAGLPRVAWNIRCSVADERHFRLGAGPIPRLLARLSTLPKVIISNSVAGKKLHESLGYRPRRWAIIPNGVDATLFRPDAAHYQSVRDELDLPAQTPLVGLIARQDPIKDHPTFLRAAQLVAQGNAEVHFLCAGQGIDPSNTALTALARELGIAGRVHFVGARNDIPRLTAALDVATCTSIAEGFPNILIEAMACAVPCVSTDVGDAALIVGDTGRVVAAGDHASLAQAILELLRRKASSPDDLGLLARNRVLSEFSLTSMVRKYQSLYDELAA